MTEASSNVVILATVLYLKNTLMFHLHHAQCQATKLSIKIMWNKAMTKRLKTHIIVLLFAKDVFIIIVHLWNCKEEG